MDLQLLAHNFLSAPVLFFFLGLLTVVLKSNLEIPPALATFFSLYLLFDIGIKGGEELYHSGITSEVGTAMAACVGMALLVPVMAYYILRRKLNPADSGALAATYGSISAVTFATSLAFLQSQNESYGGFMVAGMAFMESPAIIVGLLMVRLAQRKANSNNGTKDTSTPLTWKELKKVLHESLFNGSILLLMGSLAIGFLAGDTVEADLQTFVGGIYKGMLCFYLLDMGIIAGKRMRALKKHGLFLPAFGILFPLFNAFLGMSVAYLLGFSVGNALLFTVLCASASYIAVPAAMRMSLPEANLGLLLPMSLGITFTFNIALGIPLYYSIIKLWW